MKTVSHSIIMQPVKPLFIGEVYIKRNLVMAPMAGITDLPFRSLAKEGGAGLVCTEMLSANALVFRDVRTIRMLKLTKSEFPVSVQIFGSKPEIIAEAAKIVEDKGADILDINFGCPVHKINKSGAGVKIVENESLMVKIMEAAAKSVTIPVTIKIRIGLNKGDNMGPRIASLAYESGIKAITVHGRAAENHHSGSPDLEAVAETVAVSKIPVIGNGGVVDELSAVNFLEKTGCAGLMIGRSVIGNYNIFKRIEHYIATGNLKDPPSWENRIALLKKHALIASAYYTEKTGLVLLRKIAPYYLKGLPNSSTIRNRFNKVVSLDGLNELLSDIGRSPYFDGEQD